MKNIKPFEIFNKLNEDLNLEQFFEKNKIIEPIRELAKAYMMEGMDGREPAIKRDAPKDLTKNPNKATFWFAKTLKELYMTDVELHNQFDSSPQTQALKPIFIEYIADGDKAISRNIDSIREIGNLANATEELISTHFANSVKSKFNTVKSRFVGILDYFNSPMREEKINFFTNFSEMDDIQQEWHDNIKATGSVRYESGTKIMTFDNGFYWIDLEKSTCREEGSAAGHCGSTSKDTLLSLRTAKRAPRVTISINYDRKGSSKYDLGSIGQCKGSHNDPPIPKYHHYIVALWNELGITSFRYDEYKSENDTRVSDLRTDELVMSALTVSTRLRGESDNDLAKLANVLKDESIVKLLDRMEKESDIRNLIEAIIPKKSELSVELLNKLKAKKLENLIPEHIKDRMGKESVNKNVPEEAPIEGESQERESVRENADSKSLVSKLEKYDKLSISEKRKLHRKFPILKESKDRNAIIQNTINILKK